ncbi:hypothetical protein P154DRAFT_436790 [Amniculicola lignicola CBS 123094]|uniref:Cyclin-like protein n=1 Tax=Amniculicola lignicola CBS 123094 TaxID=1392246 RepID=A0A6A5WD77_9PLEO|nr:hypothetical protein P154DRAFT_436790 [Amniculicola lignicola CBS 123094]
MPSFYPRHNLPRQMPLTPPEFVPSYNTGCGGMPYQQNAFAGQPAIRQQEEGYDFADRYGQLAMAMPPMYPQSGTYMNSGAPTLPLPSSFYEPAAATILPPMRLPNGQPMGESALLQQQQHAQQRAQQELTQRVNPPPKDDKPVGGVSAKLDYDMETMTDFVCEMALQIITLNRPMPPSFRKWVHQVLCATRLPSATILLSLRYLSGRMHMLGAGPKTDNHLFRLLTIALVLGSKFLDDNTFINRSWSEVSGIPVADLNHLEMEWLVAIEFKLHRDPSELQGWNSWAETWKDFQAHATHAPRHNRLSPIDTTVQRQRSLNQNKPLPPLPIQQNYSAPPPYEYTPKSAQTSFTPTTGPTTPEYYGAPAEGYSRRTMFGFPPLSQPTPAQTQQQQQPANYGPPSYNTQYNAPSVWNNHGVNCGCMYCAQRHPSYFMAPGFGPQPVAV